MAALHSIIPSQQTREDRAIYRAMHLLEKRLRKPGEAFSGPNSIRKYLALNLAGYDIEVFSALWLDGQHRLIAAEHLSSGTLTQTSVYPCEVVRRALAHNAAAVIFAHNHPSGCADPSRDDLLLTHALKRALALVDVRVLDHFIVAGANVASLLELDLLDATELPTTEKHAEQVIENDAKDSQKCAAKQKVKESEKIGFDILTVKAQIRAAFALLQGADGYEGNNDLCDVGFSLIDVSKKLDEIHDCVDAIVCA